MEERTSEETPSIEIKRSAIATFPKVIESSRAAIGQIDIKKEMFSYRCNLAFWFLAYSE